MLNQKRSIIKQRVKYAISDFIMTSLALFVFNIVRYELLLTHTFGSLWSYLGSRVLVLEQIFVPIGLMGVYSSRAITTGLSGSHVCRNFL